MPVVVASGANFKLFEAFHLELLSIGIVSETRKFNYAREETGCYQNMLLNFTFT